MDYLWDPITDVSDSETGGRPDLYSLRDLWRNEQASLRDPGRVERLHDRLATEWAIETGVIERLYTVDRGVTETLIELGLQAVTNFGTSRISHSAVQLIEDQRAALDFVFETVKQERPISNSYVRELHQLLCRRQEFFEGVDQFGNPSRQPLPRGEWKKQPNNPTRPDGSVHEYCPPEFVQDEMDSLMRMHDAHRSRGIPAEVEAAWLHHRFTQIHPFQDGNGRVARGLATLVFLSEGFLPLVIRNDPHKDLYLSALETADRGDLRPLVNLFSNIQSQDLESAVTYVREIRGEGINEIAIAAAGAAKRRQQQSEANLLAITAELADAAEDRFYEVARELIAAFEQEGVKLDAAVTQSDESTESWWNYQIVAAAKRYGYFADLGRDRRWVRLRLSFQGPGGSRWSIVVSFHYKDVRLAVMSAVVFLTSTEASYDESRPVELGTQNEFSFGTTTSEVRTYFSSWLDGAIVSLLQSWQARL